MEYSLSLIIGYLIGSIPAAYLLIKKTKGVDITNSGSGNVGALNAYEVTNSRGLGVAVLIIDAIKGLLAVYIPLMIFPIEFSVAATGLLGAVFSHCFNPWLNFKGGRGLATSAAGIAIMLPYLLVVWLILWAINYFWKKDIHFANIFTTILTLFLTLNLAPIAFKYTYPRAESVFELVLFTVALFLLILIKHIDPLRELIKNPQFLLRKRR
jgi:acyl phosphate:glycerol-3-phosphate acyltransferase